MIPFPFEPNGDEDMIERVAFLTDVIEAENGTEQRIASRAGSRVELEHALLLLDAREAQRLDALLYSSQSQLVGAALWQWAGRLQSATSIGATSFSVDVESVPWRAGDMVLLVRDPFTWDALTFNAAVPPATLLTTTPATRAWSVGTIVCPMRSAWLAESVPQTLEGRDAVGARLRFALEPS